MAERLGVYNYHHIPQQTRREKMRAYQSHNQNHGHLTPFLLQRYDLDFSILKGSNFFKPAQQLLDEICHPFTTTTTTAAVDDSSINPPPIAESFNSTTTHLHHPTRKTSALISLLHQVYKRYKEYYQQTQAVIASFETVSNAAPFAKLDLKEMCNNFVCLNNAITDQIQLSVLKPQEKEEYMDHQTSAIWRPQRGLPKRAVNVLRAWLFDHFLHPYPTDADKQTLAKQTGLSRNQVSNWFINARVRVWKPMVEEVHTLESQKVDHVQQASSPSDHPWKRARNDDKHHMISMEKDINFYDNFSNNINGATSNTGVSLTLGLHQNNNPFPLNTHDRFVFDPRVIGGQFLHDFGG